MPTCRKCHQEKEILSFPFVQRKSGYSDVCKDCRKIERRNSEGEKIRRNWNALCPESDVWKKRGGKHEI